MMMIAGVLNRGQSGDGGEVVSGETAAAVHSLHSGHGGHVHWSYVSNSKHESLQFTGPRLQSQYFANAMTALSLTFGPL